MNSETEAHEDKSKETSVRKWFAGILAAVITGVLIFWLTEGLRNPTPQPSPGVNRPGDTQVNGGPISIRCSANPHILSPGSQTELVIQAISSQNTPVVDANVRVEAGGGEFVSSGSTTIIGRTDYNGSFHTIWRCPVPAASAYEMDVSVSKPGFVEGKGDCRTIVQ